MARLVAAALVAVGPARGQAPDSLTLRGHVARHTSDGERPVAGLWITLHAIGAAGGAAIDSVRSGPGGAYRFRVAADTAVSFVAAARFGGIAYFALPVRAGDLAGDSEIAVFDTTSLAIPVRTIGRHLVVAAPGAGGTRAVIDVYELQNDTALTWVPGNGSAAVFEARLPPGVLNARAGQGDFTGGTVAFGSGAARVMAAMPPGLRQLVLSYDLPPTAFPLVVRDGGPVETLEVLLEEAGASATGASLESLGAVSAEGRSFVRFLGRDVPRGASIEVRVPPTGGEATAVARVAVLAVLALVASVAVAARAPGRRVAS